MVANIVLGCVERLVDACGSEPSEGDHAATPLRKRVSYATWIIDIGIRPINEAQGETAVARFYAQ